MSVETINNQQVFCFMWAFRAIIMEGSGELKYLWLLHLTSLNKLVCDLVLWLFGSFLSKKFLWVSLFTVRWANDSTIFGLLKKSGSILRSVHFTKYGRVHSFKIIETAKRWIYSMSLDCSFVIPPCHTGATYSSRDSIYLM